MPSTFWPLLHPSVALLGSFNRRRLDIGSSTYCSDATHLPPTLPADPNPSRAKFNEIDSLPEGYGKPPRISATVATYRFHTRAFNTTLKVQAGRIQRTGSGKGRNMGLVKDWLRGREGSSVCRGDRSEQLAQGRRSSQHLEPTEGALEGLTAPSTLLLLNVLHIARYRFASLGFDAMHQRPHLTVLLNRHGRQTTVGCVPRPPMVSPTINVPGTRIAEPPSFLDAASPQERLT